MSKKVGIIVGGYMRINFEKWTPNGVLMTIIKFYESGNIIPCRVYNHQYKLQTLKDDILCDNIVSLYVNWKSIYCITNGNDLYVKGYNTYGQLGIDGIGGYIMGYIETSDIVETSETVINLCKNNNFDGNIDFISHGCNNDHTFIVTYDNKLYGCGRNNAGQLGFTVDFDNENIPKPRLIEYAFDSNIIQIECALRHSLFLTSKGNVYGCGSNDKFVLSNKYKLNETYGIIKLEYFKNITKIGVSNDASFGLNKDGILYMFGSNRHGLLCVAEEEYSDHYYGKLCNINMDINTFAMGAYYVVFLTNDNKLYSFGANAECQCGIFYTFGSNIKNKKIYKPTFIDLTNITNDRIIDIKCGYDFTYIITNKNKYYGCGCNVQNELFFKSEFAKIYPFKEILINNIESKIDGCNIIDIIPGCEQTYILAKKGSNL